MITQYTIDLRAGEAVHERCRTAIRKLMIGSGFRAKYIVMGSTDYESLCAWVSSNPRLETSKVSLVKINEICGVTLVIVPDGCCRGVIAAPEAEQMFWATNVVGIA